MPTKTIQRENEKKDIIFDREQFINTRELAELLHKPIATIHQWTFKGLIPFYKIGRDSLYKKTDIVKWIESKFHKVTEEAGAARKGA
ncbi:MAG: DNA-binding protein [Spirochaetaceae bacterium]|nr:MAG: DNA-binding protein [Spirochaetaceae bacterium]